MARIERITTPPRPGGRVGGLSLTGGAAICRFRLAVGVRLVVPILTAFLTGACERPGPLDPPAPPTQSAATASTTVLEVPAASQLGASVEAMIEACVGEPLTIVGDGLLVFHVTILADGSRLVMVHRNPTGAFALGEVTGRRYRIGASDQFIEFVAPSGGYTATFDANLNVIGPRVRFAFPIMFHVTLTPGGELTADIEVIGPPTCSA